MKKTALYNTVALREAGLTGHGIAGSKLIISGICIDTRKLQHSDLFFCLPGEKTDGHDFALRALDQGAAGIVILKEKYNDIRDEIIRTAPEWYSQLKGKSFEAKLAGSGRGVLAVDNVAGALQKLAVYQRSRYSGTVYGITGSNGKTTVKEMLASMLLSIAPEKVWFTQGNYNNHLGVPITLASMPLNSEFAVIEMGMNHAGEISHLTGLAKPHHALITSIGRAHIEFFDSILGIASAKLEIADSLQPGSTLVYPKEATGRELFQSTVQKYGLNGVLSAPEDGFSQSKDGVRFKWNGLSFQNPNYFSKEAVYNLVSCLNLLASSGLRPEVYGSDLNRMVHSARPVTPGRFTVHRFKNLILVDDTYNANPDSFIAALRSFRSLMGDSAKLLAIAGSMAELGHNTAAGHEETGRIAKECSFDLYCCGPHKEAYQAGFLGSEETKTEEKNGKTADSSGKSAAFSGPDDLLIFIEENPVVLSGYDGILVKGSRSARMERVTGRIQELFHV